MDDCAGCSKKAEFNPPAYIWIQEMQDYSHMISKAPLCRECLLKVLAVFRADIRALLAAQARQEVSS